MRLLWEMSVSITAETPIQISLGKALAGAVALGVLICSGAYFIVSQVGDDVAATRSDVAELRQMAREDGQVRENGDAALRQSIADLTAQLQVTTAKLSEVTDGLTNLANSIDTIDTKLTASIARQQDFEKSIVARLDAPGFGKIDIPADWSNGQSAIITSIKSGGDPLAKWFNSLPEQQK